LKVAKEAMAGRQGWFGQWTKDQFGYSKQWRTRLMSLDTQWKSFGLAVIWAESQGVTVGRREFSVDGALELVERWRRDTDPEYAASRKRKAKKSSRLDPVEPDAAAPEDSEAAEVQRLRALLEAERLRSKQMSVRITQLQADLRRAMPPCVKPQTIRRAEKAAELWRRGGTDHESLAAKERLRDMADRLDIGFPSFLRACSIETPADYNFAKAA
jgi:hypothetical protein